MNNHPIASSPHPPRTEFGDLLRQVRRRSGMTQTDLAAAVGYSVSFICSLEKGDRLPDVAVVAARFLPALAIQDDLTLATKLVQAAAVARGQRSAMAVTVTRAVTIAVEEEEISAGEPLPAPPTPIIGRNRDIDLICRRMLGHNGRLLSLTGPPGVGKTRLALEIAQRLSPIYADGARFIDLAAVEDAGDAPAAVALALDLEMGRNEPADQVIAYLRRKELLLVLDNMEQILGAATFVGDLLAACPGLRVVVTSRERLHLRAEQRFKVTPLTLTDAVELFTSRAAASHPDFVLQAAERASVEEICLAVDCLPLGIELCAAHIGLHTPAALGSRLRDRQLDVLRDGPSDLPVRHHTLANAIHHSYLLLTPRQQHLLRWLAPFAGGFDLPAAEFLGFAEHDLNALVEKSLVHVSRMQEGEPRYMLLETIRSYASDRLTAAGEVEAARHDHAAYFLRLAESSVTTAGVTADTAQLARLTHNLDNLLAALRYWVDAKAHEAVRLAAALRTFWYARGHLREGRSWLMQALAVDAIGDAARGYALLSIGQLAHNLGDHADAQAALEQALVVFTELHNQRGEAAVLNELAWVYFDRQAIGPAIANFEAAVALVRQFGDPAWLAALLSSTAMVLGYQDRLDIRVRAYFAEAIELHRTVDDPNGFAQALMQLAVVEGLTGNYAQALQLAEDAVVAVTALAQPRDLAWACEIVGESQWFCNDLDGALEAYRQARTIFDELGIQEGVMLTEHHFGQIARRQGRMAAAQEHYRASLQLALQQDDARMVGRGLAGLGAVAYVGGNQTAATTLLAAAWQRFDSVPPFLAPCDDEEYWQIRRSVCELLPPQQLADLWSTGQSLTPEGLLAATKPKP